MRTRWTAMDFHLSKGSYPRWLTATVPVCRLVVFWRQLYDLLRSYGGVILTLKTLSTTMWRGLEGLSGHLLNQSPVEEL